MKSFLNKRKSRSALPSRSSTPVPSPKLPRSAPSTRVSTPKPKKKFTPILPPSSPDHDVNQLDENGQLPPGQSRFRSSPSSSMAYSSRHSISMDLSGFSSLSYGQSSRSRHPASTSNPGLPTTPQCDQYGYVMWQSNGTMQNTKYTFSSLGSSGGESGAFIVS